MLGYCYGFNSKPLNVSLQESLYKDEAMKAFYNESFGNGSLHHVEENSNNIGLQLILDRNLLFRGDWSMSQVNNVYPEEIFTLSLNNFMDIVDDEVNEVEINPGFETEIKVTATSITADSLVRSYSIAERKCRFADEWKGVMKLFTFYSQELCKYECLLEHARAKCGCTPWNYPFNSETSVNVCSSTESHCFSIEMKDNKNKRSKKSFQIEIMI